MSSFRKITFATLFLISSCGFSPLYTNDNFANLAKKIDLQEPDTQNEFTFYSHLKNRFGDGGQKYKLNYTITTSKKDTALSFDGTVHRIEISGTVAFNLQDTESGFKILSGNEEMNLNYSNSGSTAAVLNAERTTNKQLVVLLADKVADRISLIVVEKDI